MTTELALPESDDDDLQGPHGEINLNAIPDELKDRSQWVCWKLLDRDGKASKIPMQTDGGSPAKSNDMATWSDFETAVETARDRDGWGIGFVFADAGPYVGVDLDNCRDPETGCVDGWARGVYYRLDSYTEVSPSGTGLHIILRDVDVPDWWTQQKDGPREIEVYDADRFFTVTGDTVEDTSNECRSPSDFTDWLREEGDDVAEYHERDDGAGPLGAEPRLDFDVYDVISSSTHPEDERTSHPFHGSDTGANFMVDEGAETWRCWRHGVTGDALHLVGIEQGIIDCGDWDPGKLSKATWAKIFQAGREAGYDIPEPDEQSPAPESHTARTDHGASTESGEITVEDPMELSLPDGTTMDDLTTSELAYHATEHIRTHENIVAMEDNDELYAYRHADGVWRPNGEDSIRSTLRDLLETRYKQHVRREVVDQVRAERSRSRDDMGVPSGTIAVGNGLLDLDDRELRPLRPDDYALWRMPVEYAEDADCPRFESFLDDVCPDEYRPLLQEFVGYCLHHWAVPHEKALMLLGPTDAGKSVFLDVIMELFGPENTASQSIQYLVNERWGLAELEGKPVNIRHDLDPSAITKVGKAKEVISGNQMQAERKNQEPFTMQPTTKHLFSANQAPDRNADDEAFWSRWLTVVFPETIPRDEQELDLVKKLTTEEELSGVLNWAIDGYHRLMEQGQFTNEPQPWENRALWEAFGDSVEQFLDVCLEREPGAYEPKSAVYEAYRGFAADENLGVVSQHKFTRELTQKDDIGEGQRRIDGGRTRVYTGVRLQGDDGDSVEDIVSDEETIAEEVSA